MANVFDNVRFRKLLLTQEWDAYEYLYNHFRIPLINVAVRLTRDRHVAKDIVQDSFVAIWGTKEKLCKVQSVENYLAKMVQYKAMTYHRRQRKLPHLDIDFLLVYQDFAMEEDTVESLIAKELYLEFRQVIAKLPRRQNQCLTMKIDRNMSLDDIALELMISRKTVELSQHIALKKLKKWAMGYGYS